VPPIAVRRAKHCSPRPRRRDCVRAAPPAMANRRVRGPDLFRRLAASSL